MFTKLVLSTLGYETPSRELGYRISHDCSCTSMSFCLFKSQPLFLAGVVRNWVNSFTDFVGRGYGIDRKDNFTGVLNTFFSNSAGGTAVKSVHEKGHFSQG